MLLLFFRSFYMIALCCHSCTPPIPNNDGFLLFILILLLLQFIKWPNYPSTSNQPHPRHPHLHLLRSNFNLDPGPPPRLLPHHRCREDPVGVPRSPGTFLDPDDPIRRCREGPAWAADPTTGDGRRGTGWQRPWKDPDQWDADESASTSWLGTEMRVWEFENHFWCNNIYIFFKRVDTR